MQQISNRGKDSRLIIRRYKLRSNVSVYISYLLEKEIYTGTRHLGLFTWALQEGLALLGEKLKSFCIHMREYCDDRY